MSPSPSDIIKALGLLSEESDAFFDVYNSLAIPSADLGITLKPLFWMCLKEKKRPEPSAGFVEKWIKNDLSFRISAEKEKETTLSSYSLPVDLIVMKEGWPHTSKQGFLALDKEISERGNAPLYSLKNHDSSFFLHHLQSFSDLEKVSRIVAHAPECTIRNYMKKNIFSPRALELLCEYPLKSHVVHPAIQDVLLQARTCLGHPALPETLLVLERKLLSCEDAVSESYKRGLKTSTGLSALYASARIKPQVLPLPPVSENDKAACLLASRNPKAFTTLPSVFSAEDVGQALYEAFLSPHPHPMWEQSPALRGEFQDALLDFVTKKRFYAVFAEAFHCQAYSLGHPDRQGLRKLQPLLSNPSVRFRLLKDLVEQTYCLNSSTRPFIRFLVKGFTSRQLEKIQDTSPWWRDLLVKHQKQRMDRKMKTRLEKKSSVPSFSKKM